MSREADEGETANVAGHVSPTAHEAQETDTSDEGVVVDASVAMAWCLKDERSAYAAGVFERVRLEGLVVPALWTVEVTNALYVNERRGRLTADDIAEFLAVLEEVPLTLDVLAVPSGVGRVLNLSRHHGLTAYDASYLDVALRLGLPLATTDGPLTAAAAQVGVRLIEPT